MAVLQYLLILLAIVGHFELWIGAFNRLHAFALPCWAIRLAERLIMLVGLGMAAVFAWTWATPWFLVGYAGVCVIVALVGTPLWFWHWLRATRTSVVLSNETRVLDVARELGHNPAASASTRFLARVPGNQIFQLSVHRESLAIPRLPTTLDGLTITQLTDLHFTGQIARSYFDFVVDEANRHASDLVVVTGDIIDKAHCLDWIPATLGRLQSRFGVYYVLGNHDKRVPDVSAVRRTLADCGLIDVGGRWLTANVRGETIVLAGNELPWFSPAADLSDCPPPTSEGGPFRILLSHSPDQYPWAKRREFDLMLAGHTHGGQIRFPWIGAIVSASRFGTRYAAGVFAEPPTVMHVSRGLSGVHPLRLNCPPELAVLCLRTPDRSRSKAAMATEQ